MGNLLLLDNTSYSEILGTIVGVQYIFMRKRIIANIINRPKMTIVKKFL